LKSKKEKEEIRALAGTAWAMSWPMLLVMLFEFFISLTDVYIAGKLGREYQAAVGFVSQIYFIFVVFGNAFTIGTVSVISRQFFNDPAEFRESVGSILKALAAAGLILGLLGVLLSPLVISLVDVPGEVKGPAAPLIEIYAASLVFHFILINTNGILRSGEGVKKSMVTMALVAVSNIGLNFLFVFNTSLGFRGIALSTAVSVLAGSLLNLFFIRKHLPGRSRVNRQTLRRVMHIGWPSGLVQVSWQIGSMTIFLIIAQLPAFQVEVMAAVTNGLRIESAIFLPAFAFNMAGAAVVGNLMGQGREDDAFKAGLITAAMALVIITALTILVVLNAETLAGFLSDNGKVVNECLRYIYISMISEPFMAWAVVTGGALNGAGDTRSVMRVVVLTTWLVRIPGAYIFAIFFDFGPQAIWWSMNASILVHCIFITRHYLKKEWLKGP